MCNLIVLILNNQPYTICSEEVRYQCIVKSEKTCFIYLQKHKFQDICIWSSHTKSTSCLHRVFALQWFNLLSMYNVFLYHNSSKGPKLTFVNVLKLEYITHRREKLHKSLKWLLLRIKYFFVFDLRLWFLFFFTMYK